MKKSSDTGILQLSSLQASKAHIGLLIRRMLEQGLVKEARSSCILAAVMEAIDNGIRHGNRNDPSKHVNVKYIYSKNSLCFIITDQGNGFNARRKTVQPLPRNQARKGLSLMSHLCDDLFFINRGKTVIMNFLLNEEQPGIFRYN